MRLFPLFFFFFFSFSLFFSPFFFLATKYWGYLERFEEKGDAEMRKSVFDSTTCVMIFYRCALSGKRSWGERLHGGFVRLMKGVEGIFREGKERRCGVRDEAVYIV